MTNLIVGNKLLALRKRCAAATRKGRYSVSPVIMSNICFSSSLTMSAFAGLLPAGVRAEEGEGLWD
jgi:hypothetical protein